MVSRIVGAGELYEDVWGNFPGVVGIGNTSVAFFPIDDPDIKLPVGLPIHHIAFRVDRVNFNSAQQTLRQKGIEFEFQDHKIVHSIYFYDPDGHLIELTTYDLSD